MKQYIFFIFLLCGFVACNSGADKTQSTKGSSSAAAVQESPNIGVPASLQGLFSPNEGVLRGIHFTDNLDAVKRAETSTVREESSNSLSYSTDLNGDNFADIKYVFKGDKLARIEADIFATDAQSARNLYNDLVAFFDKKYKKRKLLWEGTTKEQSYSVFAKYISHSPSHGIYVVWEIL